MPPTGDTGTPSSNFHLVTKALQNYTTQTGIDLTNQPSAMQFELLDSPDAILRIFDEREAAFRTFRNKNRALINCLRPQVQILHAFSGVIGEAAGVVSHTCLIPLSCFSYDSMRSRQHFQPGKAIFVGIDVLLAVRTTLNAPQLVPP